jgi:hypothetical protein
VCIAYDTVGQQTHSASAKTVAPIMRPNAPVWAVSNPPGQPRAALRKNDIGAAGFGGSLARLWGGLRMVGLVIDT